MKQLFAFIILFMVYSCKQTNKIKTDERLLKFYSNLIYTVDSLEKLDPKKYQAIASVNFNPMTDTIKYLDNKIYVSCLTNLAGCTDYIGDIKFNKDTIELLTISATNITCTEEDAWRVVYEIENKENKKYIILKY